MPDGMRGGLGRWVQSPGTVELGEFRFAPATDWWWWSDGLYRVFGYEPGSVVPTTDLLLWHHTSAGKTATETVEAMVAAVSGERPFQFQVMQDAAAQERVVLVLCEPDVPGRRGASEAPSGVVIRGIVVDLTGTMHASARGAASEQIAEWAQANAAIEQAKGVVSALYGVGVDEAFALLRRASSLSNVKVRVLAQQVLDGAAGAGRARLTAASLDDVLRLRPSEAPGIAS